MNLQKFLSTNVYVGNIAEQSMTGDTVRGLFNAGILDVKINQSELERLFVEIILTDGAIVIGNFIIGFCYEMVFRKMNNL